MAIIKFCAFLFFITILPSVIYFGCGNCALNKVTLTEFLKDTANQNPTIDPLGGYIFLYWVDNNGNVCHGEPGVNAQPGPFVISAFTPEAYDAANSNSAISEEQMKKLQEFVYENQKYHPKGLHFVQFDNVIWRNRTTNKVFIDRASHFFSKPLIADVENTLCLTPVYAASDERCAKYNGLLLPSFPPANQHPSIGLIKSFPGNSSLTETEMLNYCVVKLPHGLEITE